LKGNFIKAIKLIVPTAVGIYLFWFFFDIMSAEQKDNFFAKISEIHYGWIGLSLLISLLSHFVRAYRWKYLLEPMGYQTSFWNRYHAIMVGYVMNMLIPRAGEASRAAMLIKSNQIPFTKSFGTIITERAIDTLMLGLVFLFTISISKGDFELLRATYFAPQQSGNEETSLWLWITVGAVVLLFAAIVFLALKPQVRSKIVSLLNNLKEGLISVFQTASPFAFIGQTILIWLLYILFFYLCFFSLEETRSISINGMLMAFIGGTVGVILTNGGIGVYPVIVGSIVTFYVFPDYEGSGAHDTAYALATITWIIQTLMMVILGIISLFYFSFKFKLSDEQPID
jgi:glycosyltransferase 2 family protein